MFLVEKKIDKNDFEKSLHFEGEGGGQGQFGKSLHFDFFFMMASLMHQFNQYRKMHRYIERWIPR